MEAISYEKTEVGCKVLLELMEWREFFAALKLKNPEGRRKSPGFTSYH
jgi:hypothetical protein